MWSQTLANLEVSSIEGCDYERVHNDISKFSILTEIEVVLATELICQMQDNSTDIEKCFKRIKLKNIPEYLTQRFKLSDTNFFKQTSLLTSHSNLFQLIIENQISEEDSILTINYLNKRISEIWLQQCKVARRYDLFNLLHSLIRSIPIVLANSLPP